MFKYILFLFFIFFACKNNDKKEKFVFETYNKKINVKKYHFSIKNDSQVYLFIEDQQVVDLIIKEPILNVQYVTLDTVLNAKLIEIAFSRELILDPFIIEIDNKTKKIVTIKDSKKGMLYIGEKDELSPYLLKNVNKYLKLE